MNIRCFFKLHKWAAQMEPCDSQLMASKSPWPVKFRKCERCGVKYYYTRLEEPITKDTVFHKIGSNK